MQHVVPVPVDPIAQRVLDVDHLDHIAASERAPRHRVEFCVELVAVARRRRLVPADPREVGGGLVEARRVQPCVGLPADDEVEIRLERLR